MSAAARVLGRLLRRSEKARLRGAAEGVSLPMTAASCPEYAALRTLAEFEEFHAQIASAERDGAVRAERDRLHGDGTRIERITVLDRRALAAHLGAVPLDTRVEQAAQRLAPWRARFGVLDSVLDGWRRGRTLRGAGPEAADDLALAALAALAVAAAQDEPGRGERILRRESARLYGDSKRLETLTPWLELLLSGELAPTGLAREDIWAGLGLRREPQPLLLAGHAVVVLESGAELPLPRPYLGVPLEAVRTVVADCGFVLTVENLASFHDAARADGAGLLIYTGGMPSPAWRAAYLRILRGLPEGVPVYHWGDIDEGGFRIAASLASTVAEAQRRLRPWRMSPAMLPSLATVPEPPSAATLAKMVAWARCAGWDEVADELLRDPLRLEQESLEPILPEGRLGAA